MPYPQNFVVRLLICLVGMYAIWIAIQYIMDVVVFHDAFRLGIIDFVVPGVMGVVEAVSWKPKAE